MLKLFDRYIIRKFLTTFVTTLSLFVIIIIVFDISEKLEDFIGKKAPLKAIIFDYYLNYVPFFLNLFSPIFIFISVIFFTSKLAGRSEIIATLAGGVSYMRIMRPYMITAGILALFSFYLNAYLIPHTEKTRLKFENRYIRNVDESFANNQHRQISPGVFFYIEYFGFGDSVGGGVSMEKYDSGRMVSKLFSRKIAWNNANKKWRLEDYMIRNYLPDSSEQIIKGTIKDTAISFDPSDFVMHNDDIQSMNVNELNSFIEKERMRGTAKLDLYITEKYRRWASPFATFILTFIGVCVSSKKSRGGVGLNLGIGIFLSFTYLFIIQYFKTYGDSGLLNPILAVWIPNIIFVAVGYYLYKNAQK